MLARSREIDKNFGENKKLFTTYGHAVSPASSVDNVRMCRSLLRRQADILESVECTCSASVATRFVMKSAITFILSRNGVFLPTNHYDFLILISLLSCVGRSRPM